MDITTCLSLSENLLAEQRFLAYELTYPIDLDTSSIECLRNHLSRDEQSHYDTICATPKRVEFMVSRVVLRQVLSVLLHAPATDLRFGVTAFGKPFLHDNPSSQRKISFNVSHSNGCLLLAVTQYGEIGVDIETLSDYHERIARRFFHFEEYDRLSHLDPTQRLIAFYHLWTVKEACVKAIGLGLQFPLHTIRVSTKDSGNSFGIWWQTLGASATAQAAVAIYPSPEKHAPNVGTLYHIPSKWLFSSSIE